MLNMTYVNFISLIQLSICEILYAVTLCVLANTLNYLKVCYYFMIFMQKFKEPEAEVN